MFRTPSLQIEETEQHLNSASNRQSVSPDDVMKAIQRLQASFTNLAGRYQKIHEAVKQQKEQYIHLHRYGKLQRLSCMKRVVLCKIDRLDSDRGVDK